jgi:hypothetical protein
MCCLCRQICGLHLGHSEQGMLPRVTFYQDCALAEIYVVRVDVPVNCNTHSALPLDPLVQYNLSLLTISHPPTNLPLSAYCTL